MSYGINNDTNFTVAVYPKGNGIDYEWEDLDISLEEFNEFLKKHGATRRLANRMLFIPQSGRNVRIVPDTILYADTCKNCTTLYLNDGETLTGICTLSELHRHLSGEGFLRIHKSYLINTRYISSFYGNVIVLENGKEFPIGHDFRSRVKSHFNIIGSKSCLYMKNSN